MSTSESVKLTTFAEISAWDPFPTSWKEEVKVTVEFFIELTFREYGSRLISIVFYEVNEIKVDGIRYLSEPLNKRVVRFGQTS